MAGFNYPTNASSGEISIPPNVQYVIGVDNVDVIHLPIGSTPSVTWTELTNTLTFYLALGTNDDQSISTLAVDSITSINGTDLVTFSTGVGFAKGADVASAATLPILTTGNYFDVTGTTNISSIASTGNVGTVIRLHFDDALTLVHHATDLILPTGANIRTAAGDEAVFVEYATGDYRCINYQKADGSALNGAVATSDAYDDMDVLFKAGMYRINIGATGSPESGSVLSLIVYGNGSNVATQLATNRDASETYVRGYNGVTWDAWTNFGGNLVDDTSPQLGGDLDTNGHQVQLSKGADVASATALPILTDGNYFDVTGTTAIASINTTGAIGTVIKLQFDGILTLTHNAADLILPSGANITTAAGDEAEFVEYASGDFRCTSYSKASGEAVVSSGGGKVLQQVEFYTGTSATGTTTIPLDNTIPQITEGTQFLTLGITPISATSKLKIEVTALVQYSVFVFLATALFRDSGADAIATVLTTTSRTNPTDTRQSTITYTVPSNSTTLTTFTVRCGGNNAGTLTFNAGAFYGGTLASGITITEVEA